MESIRSMDCYKKRKGELKYGIKQKQFVTNGDGIGNQG